MREYPNVFPDLKKYSKEEQTSYQWYSSSGFGCDVPCWDIDSLDTPIGEKMQCANGGFSIKAFDLANGQAEFDRLVHRIKDSRGKGALQNWMAERRFRKLTLIPSGRMKFF
jgi:hypothetical protein